MRHVSKTVSGGANVTTVTQVTSTFDTRGYAYATISIFGLATTVSASTATTNHALEESDNSTASFTAVTGATPTGLTTTAITTNIAKMIYNVDLRGKKRYLKVTYSSNSGDTLIATCDLSSPTDGIVSATEQGSAFSVTV